VNNLDNQAIGIRNKKYTMLNSILEFTHPRARAILNHTQSMARANAGMKIDRAPVNTAILPNKGILKIHARASKPVTMTSIVLNLS
jgi:hypothetical protein